MILPEIKIKSLVLISPSAHDDAPSEKLDIGPIEKEVEYFSNKNNWINAKSYKNISRYKGPLLVIKSENDENVPADVVDRYYEQAINADDKKIKEIKGSDHRLSEQWMRDEVFELINDWFLNTL
jgi:esterase/lipase